MRSLSWVLSLVLHVCVILLGIHATMVDPVTIDLNKQMYEVSLVGIPHKGKPGKKSAQRPAVKAETQQKAAAKETPPAPKPEQAKPVKKPAAPVVADNAKAIPTVNATVAKTEDVRPEPPKKEAVPDKTPPKKAEPKKEEKKKEPAKEKAKTEPTKPDAAAKKDTGKGKDEKKPAKTPKKESDADVLAEALGDAKKASKPGKANRKGADDGVQRGESGGSGNALSDALAELSAAKGKGTQGDGTAEDGPGEGESTGTLGDWYASQVMSAIRPNWRYPRVSSAVLATKVELTLNRSGEILGYRILNGSGRSDYDASVQQALEDTKTLPQVPKGMGTTLEITFYSTDSQ